MDETGAKTCSAKLERYLAGNAKCECKQAVYGTDRKGYDVWGREVKVIRTGETHIFRTAMEACVFMAGILADRRSPNPVLSTSEQLKNSPPGYYVVTGEAAITITESVIRNLTAQSSHND